MKRFGILTLLMGLALLCPVHAWGNGFSVYYNDHLYANSTFQWKNPPMYGTHDYLAEYALEFLPEEEKSWIAERFYFYGTELPDSRGYKESIGDRGAQILRFEETGEPIDESLKKRAMKRYGLAIDSLKRGGNGTASKWAGAIVSYVSNAGLFSRVIEDSEKGLSFENYIQRLTDIVYPSKDFEDIYGAYIEFDGMLEIISPGDAVMRIGQATYLGKKDGSCSANWMEENYGPENPEFIECAGRNFNNLINAEADVLHTIYLAGVENLSYDMDTFSWDYFLEDDSTARDEEATGEDGEDEEATGEDGGENITPLLPNMPPAPPELVEENDSGVEEIPEPELRKARLGGGWVFVIVVVVIATIAILSVRGLGGKNLAGKKAKKSKKSKKKKRPKIKGKKI